MKQRPSTAPDASGFEVADRALRRPVRRRERILPSRPVGCGLGYWPAKDDQFVSWDVFPIALPSAMPKRPTGLLPEFWHVCIAPMFRPRMYKLAV